MLWSSLDSSPLRCWCEHHSAQAGIKSILKKSHNIWVNRETFRNKFLLVLPKCWEKKYIFTSSLIFFTDSPFCRESNRYDRFTKHTEEWGADSIISEGENTKHSPCRLCFQPPAEKNKKIHVNKKTLSGFATKSHSSHPAAIEWQKVWF